MTDQLIDQVGGEKFDFSVEFLGAGVVEATGGLDFVLNILELGLKLEVVGVSLEVGVGFGDGEEVREGALERAFGLGGTIDAFRAHHGRASFGDVIKGGFFVLGVALDSLHEVRNEVGAVFELDGDVGPGFVDPLVQPDQTIISAPDDGDEDDDNRNDNKQYY